VGSRAASFNPRLDAFSVAAATSAVPARDLRRAMTCSQLRVLGRTPKPKVTHSCRRSSVFREFQSQAVSHILQGYSYGLARKAHVTPWGYRTSETKG
jgi:hypothetical protein